MPGRRSSGSLQRSLSACKVPLISLAPPLASGSVTVATTAVEAITPNPGIASSRLLAELTDALVDPRDLYLNSLQLCDDGLAGKASIAWQPLVSFRHGSN